MLRAVRRPELGPLKSCVPLPSKKWEPLSLTHTMFFFKGSHKKIGTIKKHDSRLSILIFPIIMNPSRRISNNCNILFLEENEPRWTLQYSHQLRKFQIVMVKLFRQHEKHPAKNPPKNHKKPGRGGWSWTTFWSGCLLVIDSYRLIKNQKAMIKPMMKQLRQWWYYLKVFLCAFFLHFAFQLETDFFFVHKFCPFF